MCDALSEVRRTLCAAYAPEHVYDAAMRITIDLPAELVAALDQLSASQGMSRTDHLRQAVTAYLANQTRIGSDHRIGFGAWKHKRVDGVKYQRRIRSEWKR